MNRPLSIRQWRGLVTLAQTGVLETSRAVERIHRRTAGRYFGLLKRVPVVAAPAAIVHSVHDLTLSSVHLAIRLTSSTIGATLSTALNAADQWEQSSKPTSSARNTSRPHHTTEACPND